LTTGDAFDDLTADATLGSAFGAAREERRAEEEEYTRAAARQWARHRDLVDVARELQHRGDTVSLQLPGIAFVGVIDAVGRDYVQLRTDGGRVDVALPVMIRVLARAREGGRRAEPGAPTLRARLIEYDGDELDVVIGSVLLDDELRGRVTVGRDHIVVRDRHSNETYIPLGAVAWVRPWRD
jgi:hypothetical protein